MDSKPSQAFAQRVDGCMAKGYRVESQTETAATLAKGERVNHVLHLILSIVTLGWWPIGCALLACFGDRTYVTVQVGPAGGIHQTRRRDLSGCAHDLNPDPRTQPNAQPDPGADPSTAVISRRIRLPMDYGHVSANGDAWTGHGHAAHGELDDAQAPRGGPDAEPYRIRRCGGGNPRVRGAGLSVIHWRRE